MNLLRLWGKTGSSVEQFHPVLYHMLDVGYVAQVLLREPVSPRWRRVLASSLGTDASKLASWLPWVIALHDIGKLSASFQGQEEEQKARLVAEGVPFGAWRPELRVHHSLIGQACAVDEWTTLGVPWPDRFQQVWRNMVGGHHGHFAAPAILKQARGRLRACEPPMWREVRERAAKFLQGYLLSVPDMTWPDPRDVSAAIMALTGFTILCDWLGSDSQHFSPRPDAELAAYALESADRAHRAVEAAGFLETSQSLAPTSFRALFPDKPKPRPLQEAIDAIPQALLGQPCLAILEAPTGEGKTEAALALAHRLAQASGSDELYYALPTTATSNQMFKRLQEHLRDRLGLTTQVKLIHGQAFLVEDDLRLEPLPNGEEDERQEILEWFGPRKRALLAPFGVGTIDQAELAALNVKHGALRLIGLAGKVVILDEVHAYDTYMTTIIERLLQWLAVLGASVILLSATLPKTRRAALAQAYGAVPDESLLESGAYPSLWVVSGTAYHAAAPAAEHADRRLALGALNLAEEEAEAKARWLIDAVAGGGCACWITNTVKRAQQLFQWLERLAPVNVQRMLLHAQFPLEDRQAREQELVRRYGPPGAERPARGIVVGTQVLEQSLDLDFDVMVSDLAPIDLLLQRAGRLHRHQRERPAAHAEARLWVNVQVGAEGDLRLSVDRYVYAEYILQQTWDTLAGRSMVTLPDDYRPLVEAVYGAPAPPPGSAAYPAWEQLNRQSRFAVGEACQRLLAAPDPASPFCEGGGLTFEENEESAAWIAAKTRLGEESVTVIPLERHGDRARLWPSNEEVALSVPASREEQLRLLRRSLRVGQARIVQALSENVGELPPLFKKSALLRNHWPLWLVDGQAQWATGRGPLLLRLDDQLGLIIGPEGA